MPEVDISPAGADEAAVLLTSARATYAAGLRAQRGLSAEDAEQKADGDVAALLPEGELTPGHVLLVAREEGSYVGGIWTAVQGPDRAGMAWIYHVWVEPAARGRRLSGRLISAAGDAVRQQGADSLGLNVSGDNAAAIAVYDALGFTVTAQQMSLPLSVSAR
jgi:ribosomal protein S18 acetylase RimI-like enzyme